MPNEPNQDLPDSDPPKPNQDLPKPPKPDLKEGEYVPASGDISPGAHPGGTAPTEDPRDDAGLNDAATVGVSDVVSVPSEEMLRIMRENSAALSC